MLACCVVDRVARLGSITRLGLLMLGVAAVAMVVWRPLLAALQNDIDWNAAAERIEARTPEFGQRLVTVVSRLLGADQHRGSDGMLCAVLLDVDRQVTARDPAQLLRVRQIVPPWLATVALALAFAVLARVPGLRLPVLVGRFVAPL